jgi:hypothetical protein
MDLVRVGANRDELAPRDCGECGREGQGVAPASRSSTPTMVFSNMALSSGSWCHIHRMDRGESRHPGHRARHVRETTEPDLARQRRT